MDIGVADESLNGIPYEESSENDEEIEEDETEGTHNVLQFTDKIFYLLFCYD
jgi:hypothetical protein